MSDKTATPIRPEDVISSGQARAKRLKSLRKMTGLSRKSFSEKHKISQGTMQNWETARFGGLTEKGAKTILKALRQEGIHCNFEWLMYGVGSSPRLTDSTRELTFKEEKTVRKEKPNPKSIEIELENFKQMHPNTVNITINDDSMLPAYQKGDIVAGKRRPLEASGKIIGETCIVETQDGQLLLRYIRPGSEPNLYNLMATNTDTMLHQANLYDVSLRSIAPVLWRRRKDELAKS